MMGVADSAPNLRDPSRTRVRRNAVWNLIGQGLPLALAVLLVPRLIHGMGTELFGALTLIWAFLNYFSQFDLGLGRALTQLIAESAEEDKKNEEDLISKAFTLSTMLSLIGLFLLFFSAPFLVLKALKLQGALATEMLWSLRALACGLPVLIYGVMCRAILEGKRHFNLSNVTKIPLGISTYLIPLLVIPFSRNLFVIVGWLLAARILILVWAFAQVRKMMPHVTWRFNWKPSPNQRKLLRFGKSITVSYVVTPFTDNADRFLVTSMLSISMLAYYTTPLELTNKFSIVSLGIAGVIFPEFAARFLRSPKETASLYLRGMKYILAALFPPVLLVTAYAHEGLSVWLGPKFADAGSPVIQWLALAALISGFRLIPYFFLVGIGRPHIAARYDFFELPIYAGVLYVLIKTLGLQGAALAAVLRVTVGGLLYHFLSGRLLEFRSSTFMKTLLPLALATIILLGFHLAMVPLLKAILVFGILALHVYFVWVLVLEMDDKNFILKRLGRPVHS